MKKRAKKTGRGSRPVGLRLAASFEAAKGALVLLAGCGVLLLVHRNLHAVAGELVRHLHFNPASHYPHIFIDLSSRINDAGLWALAVAALLYSGARFAEAVGLWNDRPWAEWFGLLTGAIYLPLELYELTRGISWPKVTILAVNIVIVFYLFGHMARQRRWR